MNQIVMILFVVLLLLGTSFAAKRCPIAYVMKEIVINVDGDNENVNADFTPDVTLIKRKFDTKESVNVVITSADGDMPTFHTGPVCFSYRNIAKIAYGQTKPPKPCLDKPDKMCSFSTGGSQTVTQSKKWTTYCMFEFPNKLIAPAFHAIHLTFVPVDGRKASIKNLKVNVCVRKYPDPVETEDENAA